MVEGVNERDVGDDDDGGDGDDVRHVAIVCTEQNHRAHHLVMDST